MGLLDWLRGIIAGREAPRLPTAKKRLSRRFSDDDLNDVYDKNNGHCWYCDKKSVGQTTGLY